MPSGQRLAWVADGNLWALVEACRWPIDVYRPGGKVTHPQWSPDGERLAFLVDGQLIVTAVSGAESRLYTRAEDFVWTGDSNAIVFTFPLEPDFLSSYGIWLGNVADGSVGKIGESSSSSLALSPDGNTLAYWQAEECPEEVVPPPPADTSVRYTCSVISILDLSTGESRQLTEPLDLKHAVPFDVSIDLGISNGSGLRWSPNGEWLTAYFCGVSASLCMDTRYVFAVKRDGSALRYLYTTAGPLFWAPDSSRLVLVDSGGRSYDAYPRPLVIVDPHTGASQKISPEDVEDTEPQWSPTGDVLLFTSSPPVRGPSCGVCPPEEPEQGIWLMESDGSERGQLTSAPEWRETRPEWSADGKWILFTRVGPDYMPNEGFPRTQLAVMSADGSHLAAIVDASGELGEFDWWTALQ